MIHGIGVDLLKVDRMAETVARYGKRLEQRLLHPIEREALPKARNPANFMAKAFAAKEGFVKAFGTGFRGIAWNEVGVARDGLGRPYLVYSERVQALLDAAGIRSSHLSLSDDAGFVCAMVVLER